MKFRLTTWIMDLARSVTLSDVYSYMNYLSRDRAKHANSPSTGYGLEATARARKIAAIRSFYKYLTSKAKLISENPMQDLDSPRLKKSLPRYLSLDESIQLLEAGGRAQSGAGLLHFDAVSQLRVANFRGSLP